VGRQVGGLGDLLDGGGRDECDQYEAVACLTRRQPALQWPMASKTGSYFLMAPKQAPLAFIACTSVLVPFTHCRVPLDPV